MRRLPITIYDECDAYEHIPEEGCCPCDACREARAQVVQWRESRPKQTPVLLWKGKAVKVKPYFELTDCLCIAVIVAFAGWVVLEIVRGL